MELTNTARYLLDYKSKAMQLTTDSGPSQRMIPKINRHFQGTKQLF